jgi:hypothetical protein
MTKSSIIQTVSGTLIDPLHPDPALVNIYDIAHSLSNQGRFTGHTKSPCFLGRDLYTTAEHSVHVAELVGPSCPPLQLAALLHDGGEAYLSDIASPVKNALDLTPYREIEDRLLVAVYKAYDIEGFYKHANIKTADSYILGIEARDLMGGLPSRGYWREAVHRVATHPLSVRRPWSPAKAKRKFLQLFNQIQKRRFSDNA